MARLSKLASEIFAYCEVRPDVTCISSVSSFCAATREWRSLYVGQSYDDNDDNDDGATRAPPPSIPDLLVPILMHACGGDDGPGGDRGLLRLCCLCDEVQTTITLDLGRRCISHVHVIGFDQNGSETRGIITHNADPNDEAVAELLESTEMPLLKWLDALVEV